MIASHNKLVMTQDILWQKVVEVHYLQSSYYVKTFAFEMKLSYAYLDVKGHSIEYSAEHLQNYFKLLLSLQPL